MDLVKRNKFFSQEGLIVRDRGSIKYYMILDSKWNISKSDNWKINVLVHIHQLFTYHFWLIFNFQGIIK